MSHLRSFIARAPVAALAIAVLGAQAGAQRAVAPRDLSGDWVLLPAASDFGKDGPPRSMRVEVRQDSLALLVVSHLVNDAGEHTASARYALDGSENRNVNSGLTVVSRLAWHGDSCVVEARTRRFAMTIHISDRWSLSPDGTRLTLERNISALIGSRRMLLVFARAGAAAER